MPWTSVANDQLSCLQSVLNAAVCLITGPYCATSLAAGSSMHHGQAGSLDVLALLCIYQTAASLSLPLSATVFQHPNVYAAAYDYMSARWGLRYCGTETVE